MDGVVVRGDDINDIFGLKMSRFFYEQNNLYAFKQIFIDQFDFAVREYF